MWQEPEIHDVFMSYAHADKARVRLLVAALRAQGLRVWFDENDMADFESITRTITTGLAYSKGVVAFHSHIYPTRRACQWELTWAFLAAHHEASHWIARG